MNVWGSSVGLKKWKMRYKNSNFRKVRKTILDNHRHGSENLSDRTSSRCILIFGFLWMDILFVTKHIRVPMRSSFLKIFIQKKKKRTFGFKPPLCHEYLPNEKKFSPCLTHLDNFQLFFFFFSPASNRLRKPWKTCSKLNDWLISKVPHSASTCPPPLPSLVTCRCCQGQQKGQIHSRKH